MNGGLTFGERLKLHRQRAGKSRAVVAGLVGRSEEWLRAVERGRLKMPGLPMLLRLADVLDVDDLADLTGYPSLPVKAFVQAEEDPAPLPASVVRHRVMESTGALRGAFGELLRLHAMGQHDTLARVHEMLRRL